VGDVKFVSPVDDSLAENMEERAEQIMPFFFF
jgi:hypothetical protein